MCICACLVRIDNISGLEFGRHACPSSYREPALRAQERCDDYKEQFLSEKAQQAGGDCRIKSAVP